MEYEVAILKIEADSLMYIDANSSQEAIKKAQDVLDKAAIELGIDISYDIECLNDDEDED